MAKELAFDLSLNVGDTEKKIQEFISGTDAAKKKLKELERAAIEASVNGNKALADTFAKAAGELKDTIGDTRQEINNFSSDTRKLDVAVGAVQGIAGAFAATAGAVGLLAGENEDLQKTIAVVSSSMAILNGIQQLSVTLNKSSATGAALYAAANKVLNFSIKETAASLGVLKTALIATGIGAAVVALGLLIANFEKIKAALNGISSADKDLLENTKKKVAASETELKNIGETENLLKSQGKSQRDILNLKIAAVGSAIKEQEVVLQTTITQRDAQIKAAKRNKEILKDVLGFVARPLDLLLKTIDVIGKKFGKDFGLSEGFKDSVANLIFDPEAVEEEGNKAVEEQRQSLNKLKNDLEGFKLSVKEIDKKTAADKKASDDKKLADQKAADKALEDAKIRGIEDANKRELAAFDQKAKEELEAAGKNEELKTALIKAQGIERQAIVDKQAQAAADAQKEIDDKKAADKKIADDAADAAEKERQDKLDKEQDERDKKELERSKALNDAKMMALSNTFSILNDLNTTFANKNEKNAKKAFENNKKIQIAETLVNTYLAAQKAYASSASLGPVAGAISAGIAVAAGLANVAKIKSTTFGGSVSGGSVGGGSTPSAPGTRNPFNEFGSSSVIRPEGISGDRQSQRVYVVESDISKTQNRVRVIEQNSNGQF